MASRMESKREVRSLEEQYGDDLDKINRAVRGLDPRTTIQVITDLVVCGQVDIMAAGLFYGRMGRTQAEE